MPLTLRPTGLSRDPNAKDWCVYDGGREPVGRIHEYLAAPTPDVRWLWSIQITGAHEAGIDMNGSAPTLDTAKAAFKMNYEAWQDWRATGMRHHKITDAVSAEIIRWEGGRVGVTFIFDDGQRDSREAGAIEWPIIHRLKAAGMLTYSDDMVREGIDEIISRGLR